MFLLRFPRFSALFYSALPVSFINLQVLGVFDGSNRFSRRVRSEQGEVTRPVTFEKPRDTTRPDPTYDISIVSFDQPDPTREFLKVF